MYFIFKCGKLPLVIQVALWLTVLPTAQAFKYGRPQAESPSSLRIRPPPMTADPISPDCYNFTIGNWRLQEFYSPNYPGEYLNSTDCVLYLEAPSGFRIQLDFRDEFTLEKSDGCKYDFLEVRDGPFAYSPVIGRYCGAIFPPLVESTNRFLWLRFKTDDLLQYSGFRAVYSYHKDHTQNDGTSLSKVTSTVCRIPLRLEPGHPDGLLSSAEVPFGDVTDPNYPRDRPVDCTWEIFTEQGHSINLHTLKMAKRHAKCENSHVSLYQGTTLHSDRRARLCGNDAPDVMSLTFQNNRVFVRLYGKILNNKPELEMVYSLVKTDDSCKGGALSCGGQFCISPSMRCNGVPNCPDGRDERGCPRGGVAIIPPEGGGSDTGRESEDQTPASADDGGSDLQDGEKSGESDMNIPLHMIILGAVGGVLLTSILLGICIMCRSRRNRRDRQGKSDDSKGKGQGKSSQRSQSSGVKPSHAQHHHSFPRHDDGRSGSQGQGHGQGHPQGRYLTFAHVSPLPKDNTNRFSFTSTNMPPGSDGSESHGDIMSDSGQFRRFVPVDVSSDHMEDGCLYTPQGVIIGMTHLPSSATTTTTSTNTPIPHESSGGYPVKYHKQWQKGVMEDSAGLYHPPYGSSLPRPTPFLGLSSPYQGDGKYTKSMQGLKIQEEDAMKGIVAS